MRRKVLIVFYLVSITFINHIFALSIYAVGDPSNETKLNSLLVSWGHEIEWHGVSVDDPQDVINRGFDLVYLTPSGTSTGMDGWGHAEIPIIVSEPAAADINFWINENTQSGGSDTDGYIDILNTSHPITLNLGLSPRIVDVPVNDGEIDIITLGEGFVGTALAEVASGIAIGYLDYGDLDRIGWAATHRRAFIPFRGDAGLGNGFTSQGEQLIMQTINWVVPEPTTLSLLTLGGLMLMRRRNYPQCCC
jgi:hypothetical protein